MSRLPDLERALFDAAAKLDDAPATGAAPAPRDHRHARGWRRGGSTPVLAALACLLVAGTAAAAVSGLLATGDPVPDAPRTDRPDPVPAGKELTLANVRAPDPDGGPDWGIGTYTATFGNAKMTCMVVGRVQDGRLGVVGRDGVFGNDGRFHPLSPAAQSSDGCGGRVRGWFFSVGSFPPIPASGYTGAPGTSIGGCRERVNLDGPTVSPQTRRKLRDVPQCSVSGLRRVVAGFAGPLATSATLTAGNQRKTLKLSPQENGAYLFVMRSASTAPVRLSITDRAGRVCRPFDRGPLQAGAPPGKLPRGAMACARLAGVVISR